MCMLVQTSFLVLDVICYNMLDNMLDDMVDDISVQQSSRMTSTLLGG